ncbi:imidazoleglycerol-phosphate dehydratase HisB [Candidatus Vidania fulgoroideorum]
MKNNFFLIRKTKETKIFIQINFNKKKNIKKIKTGICFFDHMLQQFSFHGNFYLKVKAIGDIEVDFHHLVEDVGLALGTLFKEIIKKRKYIRYSLAYAPMDESLTRMVMDISGRPYLIFNIKKKAKLKNGFDILNVYEFFKSFTNNSKVNIHIKNKGIDPHHRIESIFKCFGILVNKSLKLPKLESKKTTK